MIDPFEDVAAPEMPNPLEQLTTELSRSMMWDMIGPINMKDHSDDFGQNPASMDVLEAEAQAMWKRKQALMVFGQDLPLFCTLATEAASNTLITANDNLKNMPEQFKMQYKQDNLRVSALVTASVISHMLQKGMLKFGDRYYELLGK